jgi:uncharacterized membrane protein YgdD (TMEM256/DUF423 family)
MNSGLAQYNLQAVPVATAARLGARATRLMAVYLYAGSAASSVEFKNAATDTGTVLFSMDTLTASGQFVDLTPLGGIAFDVGCFCKPAGTVALVYAWFE